MQLNSREKLVRYPAKVCKKERNILKITNEVTKQTNKQKALKQVIHNGNFKHMYLINTIKTMRKTYTTGINKMSLNVRTTRQY